MTPAEYVDEIVVPTIIEFKSMRRSRRHAYLACIAAFHVKDHLKKAGETSIETAIRTAEPLAFDLVRAVCNGTKHVKTDATHLIPFQAGDDMDRPAAIWGEAAFDVSRWDDEHGGREVAAGTINLDIYECVQAVLFAFKAKFPIHLGNCDLSGI
ncbi:hypothetical protein [Inquilinus limosus]|uniref:hypothetical protein n=1 Tax=Inquilinus limosus TaxID=171674 RepID=UPI00119826B3|nr:hypothetical protein [Inquilinus limosus]